MPVQTAVVVRQPKAGRVVTGGQGPAGANAAVADATAAALADIDDAINTTGKTARKLVFDTTNNRLMIATGATASAPWFVADGSASVTPA
jgi:hypothetical protein